MALTGSDTRAHNAALLLQPQSWARARGGWEAFDSSTSFRLPDGSVLSPTASPVAQERWSALSAEEHRGFVPLCPDLVVELASPSDEGPRGLTALSGDPLFPGLTMDLEAIWAGWWSKTTPLQALRHGLPSNLTPPP